MTNKFTLTEKRIMKMNELMTGKLETPQEILYQLYTVENKSIHHISDKFLLGYGTTHKLLQDYNILKNNNIV